MVRVYTREIGRHCRSGLFSCRKPDVDHLPAYLWIKDLLNQAQLQKSHTLQHSGKPPSQAHDQAPDESLAPCYMGQLKLKGLTQGHLIGQEQGQDCGLSEAFHNLSSLSAKQVGTGFLVQVSGTAGSMWLWPRLKHSGDPVWNGVGPALAR